MKRTVILTTVCFIMVLSLLIMSCGTAQTVEEEPGKVEVTKPQQPQEQPKQEQQQPKEEQQTVEAKPQYGGTLVLTQNTPMDDWNQSVGLTVNWNFLFDTVHAADWTKGNAGGYGVGETDWASSYDRFDHYTTYVVDSYDWSLNEGTDEATIVYHVRQGVHYYQIPGNPYSAKAGGREMTADDVVWTMRWQTRTPGNYLYVSNPYLRDASIEKTGPWEVTVKFTGVKYMMPALTNLNGKYSIVRAPEAADESGKFLTWEQQIGTGPFMVTDYVPESQGTIVKNQNYWGTDPIGPGKGNKLPYIDSIRYLIIPDLSTRQAALRTGKIDTLFGFGLDDAGTMRTTAPGLMENQYYGFNPDPLTTVHMKITEPPFDNLKARQAMIAATDFESVRQGLNQGQGFLLSYPFMYNKAYADLWREIDDPTMPQKVRDLYTYNPDKARQLLADAGYPQGFKVDVMTTNTQVDYLSVLKDMWAKVGIELNIDVMDQSQLTSLLNAHKQAPLSTGLSNSVGRFYQPWTFTGNPSYFNPSGINDPVINEALDKTRSLALTDMVGAMHIMRDLTGDYILEQAYAIPAPAAPVTVFWWPWVKNYSGELQMLLGTYNMWAKWVWIDRDLKKSMGY